MKNLKNKLDLKTKVIWSGCLIQIPKWRMAQIFMEGRNEANKRI